MFGRQHLQNITGEIQKDMQLQAEQESQDLVESSLVSSHLGNESSQSGDGICDSQHDITEKTSPVDVQGFIHGFLQENLGTLFSLENPSKLTNAWACSAELVLAKICVAGVENFGECSRAPALLNTPCTYICTALFFMKVFYRSSYFEGEILVCNC